MEEETIERRARVLAAVLVALLAACQSGGRQRTVYAGLQEQCKGTSPCIRVRDQVGGEGDWQEVAAIDGFTAEKGFVYRLHVRDSGGALTLVDVVDRTRTGPAPFKEERNDGAPQEPGSTAAPPTKAG